MKSYEKIVHKYTNFNMIISGAFLLAVMVLVIANVLVRAMGSAIPGSYELVEAGIIVVASLALSYTAMRKAHVAVDIVFDLLPNKVKMIFTMINQLESLFVIGVIFWVSLLLVLERGWEEETHLLEISFWPFRAVWVYGLISIIGVYVLDFLYGTKGQLRHVVKFGEEKPAGDSK
ncbi:TRAP transporter small permease [Thermodesulfobacteriota bacterium]